MCKFHLNKSIYRFSDISGKLDEHKFHQSYQFLDQYQEREVESIEKALKQAKNPEVAAELKHKLKRLVFETIFINMLIELHLDIIIILY